MKLYEGNKAKFKLQKNHFEIKNTHVLFKNYAIKFRKSIAIFKTGKDFIILNKNHYNQKIIILKNSKGQVQIINELEIDDYLAGVLQGEISYSWPYNAIATQAISARSYAYYLYHKNKNKPFHIISGEIHQVFHGSYNPNPRFIKAVQQTKGKILVYQDQAIQTFFHASCGGITEKPHLIWGGEAENPTYQSIKCDYCKTHPKYKWEYILSKKWIQQQSIISIRINKKKNFPKSFNS